MTDYFHHCQDCKHKIPLYDVQGHYSGVCTSCLAEAEHPSAAGNAAIAEDLLAQSKKWEQQRRERGYDPEVGIL